MYTQSEVFIVICRNTAAILIVGKKIKQTSFSLNHVFVNNKDLSVYTNQLAIKSLFNTI